MFLVPACLAGTADALILYLNNEWDLAATASGTVGVFYPRYVPILAWIRLGLLGAPLSYHTYTGTRLYCPLLYQLFYVASLLSLVVHMVSILMLDPDSVRTVLLFLLFRQNTTQTTTSASSPPEGKGEEDHELAVDRLWLLLWLSVVATVLHFALLFHVRSSAPYRNLSRPQKKSRLLAYYASRHWNHRFASFLTQQKEDQYKNRSHNYTAIPNVNDSVNNSDDVYRRGSDAGSNALWMSQHEDDSDHENNLEPMPPGPSQQANHTNIMMCLPDGYDDFMSDFQMRLATTKQKWVERLDEFTHRFHLPHHHAAASNHPHGGDHSTGEEQQRMTPLFHPLQAHMTPFRVLLQLFAYEEVLTNGKLDLVFDADNEAALTFYVPQLLSFLLHGAFFNSPQLEEWILAKCKSNVHFAHCCFWFLRAWCSAHHPNHHHLANSIDSFDDDGGADSHDRLRRHGSENDLNVAALPFPYDTITSTSPPLHKSPGQGPRRVSSFHDRISMLAETEIEESHKKYAPEERTLIEGLLLRVMECGEEAAQKLQYGATGQPDDTTLVGLKNEASETRFIPVNPHTGYPSVAHLNAVTAKKKIGFMSLDHIENDKNDKSNSTNHPPPPLHPTGRRSPLPMAHKSFPQVNNLNKNNGPYGGESIFQQTPKFLSTLLSLADDLFLLPRPQRTTELRRRLRALEIQYLPSNAIYMPIKDTHHRVWRIVVDESLAISTKERVPCIICLEVIDYNYYSSNISSTNTADLLDNSLAHSKPPSGRSTSSENMSSKKANGSSSSTRTTPLKFLLSKQKKKPVSEYELVSRWSSQPRDPHRHDTIKDKVISITQEGFRKGLQSLRKHQHKQDALFWKDGDQDENQELEGLDLEVGNATGAFQNLSESFLEKEESTMSFPSTKSVQNTLDDDPLVTLSVSTSFPPPLGGSLSSLPLSACSSRSSSRPQSPTTAMGQWSSPKLNRREAMKISSEEPIPMIPDLEPDPDTVMDALSQIGQKTDSHYQHYNGVINSKTPETSPSKLPRNKSSSKKKPSEARRPKIIFKESWAAKESRIREKSAYGSHPGWRLLPILIKSNDDLRQEQLASQLISRMASILARARVPTWLFPYEILALNDRGGIIEAIPDTISIDSLKRNDPDYTNLTDFFISHFGQEGSDEHSDARACFVESLAAYSMVCFLLQIKDRHNGNIMLDQKGHLIHIDFGFFFLSSPGKNSGFESAPFKLTRDFVDLMDGPDSRHFAKFRELCCKSFLELRKHCYQIILLVEMLMVGNEDLNCFRGRPEEAVQGLRDRFRLDLNDRACIEYVNGLIDESLENWRTRWYDRYQRICVGVL